MHPRVVFLLFLLPLGLLAQDWEQRSAEQRARVELRNHNQQARIELEQYRQMQRIWEEKGLSFSPAPDPDRQPPRDFDPASSDPLSESEVLASAEEPAESEEDATSVEQLARMPQASPALERAIEGMSALAGTQFFGYALRMHYDPEMLVHLPAVPTESSVAAAWEQLLGTEYKLFIVQLQREAHALQVNDWGYCLMVNELGKKMFLYDKNTRVLFTHFILSHSGYRSAVGISGRELHLLIAVKQTLYGHTYLQEGAYKFYALDLDGGEVELSKARIAPHPDSGRPVDMNLTVAPKLPYTMAVKPLTFTYRRQEYRFTARTNRNLISYYQSYPFVNLPIYLHTPLSDQRLLDSLRVAVEQLKVPNDTDATVEQVNFLLQFVQKALPYKTDAEQFGRERYLFAEESLFYPYTDCEDRAVLFVQLVKEIMGLDAVCLMYTGHVGAAVAFPAPPKGDRITYKGKTYTICDPSYINADVGRSLPDVKGQNARIVE